MLRGMILQPVNIGVVGSGRGSTPAGVGQGSTILSQRRASAAINPTLKFGVAISEGKPGPFVVIHAGHVSQLPTSGLDRVVAILVSHL